MDRREFLAGSGAVAILAAAPIIPAFALEHRYFLMPDILRIEDALRIEHENSITTIYRWMMRIDTQSDKAWVSSIYNDHYARWLSEDVEPGALPPHIGFGGAIIPVSGGDPTFHERWKAFARTLA